MKIGLVLSGGGARGAYQIGVWKALKKLGISNSIDAVSGTSIGALNGILFLNGNLRTANRIWRNIDIKEILPVDKRNLRIREKLLSIGWNNISFIRKHTPRLIVGGNISRKGIEKIIDSIDMKIIKNSNKDLYVACTKVPKMEVEYFFINNKNVKDIKSILLASSALPIIYDEEEFKGNEYLDGGIIDNVPIKPLYEIGCKIILVVNLWQSSIIDKSKFPNSKIIELRPSNLKSDDISEALNFDKRNISKLIKQGYLDTMDTFIGIKSFFEK